MNRELAKKIENCLQQFSSTLKHLSVELEKYKKMPKSIFYSKEKTQAKSDLIEAFFKLKERIEEVNSVEVLQAGFMLIAEYQHMWDKNLALENNKKNGQLYEALNKYRKEITEFTKTLNEVAVDYKKAMELKLDWLQKQLLDTFVSWQISIAAKDEKVNFNKTHNLYNFINKWIVDSNMQMGESDVTYLADQLSSLATFKKYEEKIAYLKKEIQQQAEEYTKTLLFMSETGIPDSLNDFALRRNAVEFARNLNFYEKIFLILTVMEQEIKNNHSESFQDYYNHVFKTFSEKSIGLFGSANLYQILTSSDLSLKEIDAILKPVIEYLDEKKHEVVKANFINTVLAGKLEQRKPREWVMFLEMMLYQLLQASLPEDNLSDYETLLSNEFLSSEDAKKPDIAQSIRDTLNELEKDLSEKEYVEKCDQLIKELPKNTNLISKDDANYIISILNDLKKSVNLVGEERINSVKNARYMILNGVKIKKTTQEIKDESQAQDESQAKDVSSKLLLESAKALKEKLSPFLSESRLSLIKKLPPKLAGKIEQAIVDQRILVLELEEGLNALEAEIISELLTYTSVGPIKISFEHLSREMIENIKPGTYIYPVFPTDAKSLKDKNLLNVELTRETLYQAFLNQDIKQELEKHNRIALELSNLPVMVAKKIEKAICDKNITSLNLSNLSIDDVTAPIVAKLLAETPVTKLNLNLSNNPITEIGKSQFDSTKFVIDSSYHEEYILLTNLPGKIQKLLEQALFDKSITDLNLSFSQITDEMLEIISKIMEKTNLSSINLSNNLITSQGMMALRNSKLTNLNLSHNNIDELEALSDIDSLSELDISHNRIQDETLDSLKNLRLKKLNVSNNQIGYDGLEKLKNYKIEGQLDVANNLFTKGLPISVAKQLEQALVDATMNAVDFSNQQIDDQAIIIIVKLLKHTKVTSLKLSGNKITGQGLNALRGLKLTQLDLSHNNINDLAVLSDIDTLHELNISHNQIQDETLDSLKNLPLKKLNVSNNQIGYNGLEILKSYKIEEQLDVADNLFTKGLSISVAKQLEQALADATMNTVDFSNQQIDDQAMIIIGKLLKYTKITSLNLARNKISGQGLNALRGLKLTQLDLSHNKIATLEALSTMDTLLELDICHNQITDNAMASLENLRLNKLDISNNQVGYIGFEKVIEYGITQLEVRRNSFWNALPSLVANRLDQALSNKEMTTLDLSNLQIDDRAMLVIGKLLKFTNITKLDLSNNQISNRGLEALNDLKLTELDLSHNQIIDIKTIASNQSLTVLHLSHNQLNSEGIVALKNLQLTELDLSHNRINALGMLSDNVSLCKLNLSHNQITDDAIVSLKNIPLKKLNLSNNLVGYEGLTLLKNYKIDQLFLANNVFCQGLSTSVAIKLTEALSNKEITELSLANLNINDQELAIIGKLIQHTKVKVLDLTNNKISGESIETLKNLAAISLLDLSANQLAENDIWFLVEHFKMDASQLEGNIGNMALHNIIHYLQGIDQTHPLKQFNKEIRNEIKEKSDPVNTNQTKKVERSIPTLIELSLFAACKNYVVRKDISQLNSDSGFEHIASVKEKYKL